MHAGTFVLGLFMVTACAARAQEPPPVPTVPPQTPPPATGAPAVQTPPPAQGTPATEAPAQAATAPAPVTPAPVAPLSPEQIRERRNAIFLMEGVFVNAVRLAAANTADQIQAVQPGLGMFTSAPARAHGSYIEGYGVFFHVEIPGVMPSVASIFETLGRERQRQGNPAQPTAVGGAPAPSASALINPDAHYVESVKRQLLNAMLDHSKALDLAPDEWLMVEAREAQEVPGQISQPSTLVLRVRGADLSEFLARRLSRDEVLKRVQVRGF